MKFLTAVSIFVLLFSLYECKALDDVVVRQDTDNWPKIIGLKQFEDFLRLIQNQIFQINNQLMRLVESRPTLLQSDASGNNTSPLFPSPETVITTIMQQIEDGIRRLQQSLASLGESWAKIIRPNYLQADTPAQSNPIRIPGLGALREYVALLQKQLADFTNSLSRVLGGVGYLQEDQKAPLIPQVPFLIELQEFVALLQKQLSRFGDNLQRLTRIVPDSNANPNLY